MSKPKPALQNFRLQNFKAVQDSGVVKFTPLTVFIGNNGSGKSSLIEGLETFQSIVVDGLEDAMNRWRGFEFVWNKARADLAWSAEQKKKVHTKTREEINAGNGLSFDLPLGTYKFSMAVGYDPEYDEVCILKERLEIPPKKQRDNAAKTDAHGKIIYERDKEGNQKRIDPLMLAKAEHWVPFNSSILEWDWDEEIRKWQFLSLDPQVIAEPRFVGRRTFSFKLNKDGSNIGDYLQEIFDEDESIFNGIVDTVRYVLPYAKEIDTPIASELGRQRYIQLLEQQSEIPGWLLSTGTLRVLTLLAVLRHPSPPPLLCIEEIENGLDPRTLNLIVEEIHRATQSGKTQVICTTHSPYFLDLLPLSSIIVVERDESGQPTFTRPDEKALGEWATKFAPGQLYTMSQLTRS
jgi:predicted ATPase